MYVSMTEPPLAATLSFPTSRRRGKQRSSRVLQMRLEIREGLSAGARAGRHVYLIEVEGFNLGKSQREQEQDRGH